MQLIMLVHIDTASLFWAKHLSFLKMLVSFYVSVFFQFLNFKDITFEIYYNIWVLQNKSVKYMAWKIICKDFEIF